MSRASRLLGDDMESGGYIMSGSSSSTSSSSSSPLMDAIWGTRERKAITICSAVTILILFIVIIALAAKNDSSSSSSPSFIPNSGIYSENYLNTPFLVYPGKPDTSPATMKVNLTIGFIADTYITEDTQSLYKQMVADGAELIVVSGDLDYLDYPDGWNSLITKTLNDSFPVITAAGNHDQAIWPEYQSHIVRRWQNANIKTCNGVVGVAHTCTWGGVTIVQIAPGVFNDSSSHWKTVDGLGNFDFVNYINESFINYPSPWRVCSWHKNQHLMQTGDKTDETGWGVYMACQAWGAMIMTGHEHSYERTYQMSDLQSQKIKTTSNPKQLTLSPVDAIVVVQGLGGRGIRVDKSNTTVEKWWAAKANADIPNTTFSSNICKYNLNGNVSQAYCYAKDLRHRVIDEYWITLNNA